MTHRPRHAGTAAAALGFAITAAVATLGGAAFCMPACAQPAVTTYHNDASRTGWNPAETALTVASVGGLHLQHSVVLDEQVDAQPLYVTHQTISGQGAHEVVYVATEANTVYAVDAATGAILLSRSLGGAVPASTTPGRCNNNAPVLGIQSTPAIDVSSGTMWVISYTFESNHPVYRLHALDLSSLADKMPSRVVTASATLADGSAHVFDAFASRQRSALLFENGNIYAGFASFCDIRADLSRGWVLGWNAATLAPLPANELTNKVVGAPHNFYLSSVWMSGDGLAASGPGGAIFFTTGNADPSGTTFNNTTNLAESYVKLSSDLSTVLGHFTPSDESALDKTDEDFGSGGSTLLPTAVAHGAALAVAAGKDGNMFLMNTASLGGYHPGGANNVIATSNIGPCWCGPSYFTGADGRGRVVSSGASDVMVWKLNDYGLLAAASAP
ncbi:MAG: hypothetical protein JOZ17_03080 [Acetobacteraceae bacterium]|nr:hypothetical protein [Acetobacteraceae bacterium]